MRDLEAAAAPRQGQQSDAKAQGNGATSHQRHSALLTGKRDTPVLLQHPFMVPQYPMRGLGVTRLRNLICPSKKRFRVYGARSMPGAPCKANKKCTVLVRTSLTQGRLGSSLCRCMHRNHSKDTNTNTNISSNKQMLHSQTSEAAFDFDRALLRVSPCIFKVLYYQKALLSDENCSPFLGS